MSRPIFRNVVHIEGLDLAGKTTTSRLLAAQLQGAPIRHNALTTANEAYRAADAARRAGIASSDELHKGYVDAAWHDATCAVAPNRMTVQDSTIVVRSLAHYRTSGTPEQAAAFEALLPDHPRFGLSVVLVADMDARRRRLAERQRLAPEEVAADDLLVIRDPERFLAAEAALVAVATEHFGAVVIDTSDISPYAVALQIATRWGRST